LKICNILLSKCLIAEFVVEIISLTIKQSDNLAIV